MVETRSSKRQRERASTSQSHSSPRQMPVPQRGAAAASASQRPTSSRLSSARQASKAGMPVSGPDESEEDDSDSSNSDDEDDDETTSTPVHNPPQFTREQQVVNLMSVFDPEMRVPGEDARLAASGVGLSDSGAAFRRMTASLSRATLRDPALLADLSQDVPLAFWAQQTAIRLQQRMQNIFLQLRNNIANGPSHGRDVHDTTDHLRNLSQAIRIIVQGHFHRLEPAQRYPFTNILVDLVTTVSEWDRDAYASGGAPRPAYDEDRNLYHTLIGDASAPLFVVDVLRLAGPAEYRHRLRDLHSVYTLITQRFRTRNPNAQPQLNQVLLAWHQLIQVAAPQLPAQA